MMLDLELGRLNVFHVALYFEYGLAIAARRDNVSVGCLLNALDGRSFRTHDQTDNLIGNADFFGYLTRLDEGQGLVLLMARG